MFTRENAQENKAVYEKAQERLRLHGISPRSGGWGSVAEWEKTKRVAKVVIAEIAPLFPNVPKKRIKAQVQNAARPKW